MKLRSHIHTRSMHILCVMIIISICCRIVINYNYREEFTSVNVTDNLLPSATKLYVELVRVMTNNATSEDQINTFKSIWSLADKNLSSVSLQLTLQNVCI